MSEIKETGLEKIEGGGKIYVYLYFYDSPQTRKGSSFHWENEQRIGEGGSFKNRMAKY